VWLAASYDAAELGSLTAVVEHYANAYGKGASVALSSTRFLTLPACRLTLSAKGGVEEVVLAYRAQPDGTGIVYTIGLRCSPADCESAREAVEQIRKAGKLRPIR